MVTELGTEVTLSIVIVAEKTKQPATVQAIQLISVYYKIYITVLTLSLTWVMEAGHDFVILKKKKKGG